MKLETVLKRTEGFYWVRSIRGWVVAEWITGPVFREGWRITGDWQILQDEDFDEIYEQRIKIPQ